MFNPFAKMWRFLLGRPSSQSLVQLELEERLRSEFAQSQELSVQWTPPSQAEVRRYRKSQGHRRY